MLSISSATRIFVALNPIDTRLSPNGLHALTQTALNQEVGSGHLFILTNKEEAESGFCIGMAQGYDCAQSLLNEAPSAGRRVMNPSCVCAPKRFSYYYRGWKAFPGDIGIEYEKVVFFAFYAELQFPFLPQYCG